MSVFYAVVGGLMIGFIFPYMLMDIGFTVGKSSCNQLSNFVCTESAIVNGVAECVKYERKVER